MKYSALTPCDRSENFGSPKHCWQSPTVKTAQLKYSDETTHDFEL